jgi:hypothetical protein
VPAAQLGALIEGPLVFAVFAVSASAQAFDARSPRSAGARADHHLHIVTQYTQQGEHLVNRLALVGRVI